MKKKIVIRVSMSDHRKGRSKALEIASRLLGVESIALLGEHNDKIEVIGDEVDVVGLARSLRKKFGHAELLNVGPADQKKEEENESTTSTSTTTPTPLFYTDSNYPYEYSGPYYIYNVVPSHEPYCSIM